MSELEIARLCPSCGASIRDAAFFCPQCGADIRTTSELTKPEPAKDRSSIDVATAPLNEPPKRKEQADAAAPSVGEFARKPKQQDPWLQKPKPPEPTQPMLKNLASPAKGATSRTDQATGMPNPGGGVAGTAADHTLAHPRVQVQQATGLARSVRGDVVQRGQKLREMSGAVLDEATYDPSVRFVLVAAALFVLFLLIVLLNRFIV